MGLHNSWVLGDASTDRIWEETWRVLALLAFCIFINYVDRGNLSIAVPLLKELGYERYLSQQISEEELPAALDK